jgi:gas vesicle protein
MGPTANDLDRLDAMDDTDVETDTDMVDTVVVVSIVPDDLDATRSQIDQTRAEMSETVDALKERLNPRHLGEQAKDTVREATIGRAQDAASAAIDTARDTGMTLLESIKENPIPAALTGIGIAWLLMSARRSSPGQRYSDERPTYGYGPGYPEYGDLRSSRYPDSTTGHPVFDRATDMASRVQEKAGQIANQVQDKAGQIAGQVQDKAGQVVDQVQDKTGQIVDQMQNKAQQLAGQVQGQVSQLGAQGREAVDSFQQMLRQNPLAMGAVAMALGMAAGLAVPETPQENRWMGELRDDFVQKAHDTAHDVLEEKAHQVADVVSDKVHDVAQQAADAVG